MQIVDYFLNGMCETLEKMAGIHLEQSKSPTADSYKFNITSSMILNGDKNLVFSVSTNMAGAATLVSYMTGLEKHQLDEMVIVDGISELVNMTAGMAKMQLSEKNIYYSLSSPFAIVGKEFKIIVKQYVERTEALLVSEEISLKIGIYFF